MVRLLLVEPSPHVAAQALRCLAEREGYELLSAESAHEALETDACGSCDLAIVGPATGGAGPETCAQLKSDIRLRGVGVLLATADASDPVVDAALAAGAADVLPWPVPPSLLHARVRAALDAARSAQALEEADRRLGEELTRHEAALRQSEERYRRYIDNSPLAVFVADAQGRYIEVNAAACRWTGYEQSELLAMGIPDLLEDPENDGSADYRARLAETGRATGQEFAFRRKDGSRLWMTVDAVAVEDGRSLAFCVDVTARRRAEEALRASEGRLKALSDAAVDAIVMIDPAGRVVYWNPAAEKMFRYRAEEVMGQPVHRLIAPSRYHQMAAQGLEPFSQTGAGAAIGRLLEFEARRKDGIELPVELSLAPVPLGDRYGAVAVIRDVTRRKRAEMQLQQYTVALESANEALREFYEAAQSANQAKSQFLANMSHELRTPLHGILSFSAFGIKKIEKAGRDDLLRYFHHIENSGKTLLALVNDLLDLAKLESGKMQFAMGEVDLDELLRSTAAEFTAMLAQRRIDLDYHLSEESCVAVADSDKLRQVIRNLLSNAIKFSDQGSTIDLILSRSAEGLSLSVADRGVGIPPEELETIFDEFVQSSKTRTAAGGTGLGLAISRQIVGAHRGHIWAENRPGGGTVVTLRIPFDGRTTPLPDGHGASRAPASAQGARGPVDGPRAASAQGESHPPGPEPSRAEGPPPGDRAAASAGQPASLGVASAEAALCERVKELACMHRIRDELEKGLTEDELCQSIVEHLARGMQFPATALARIELGDRRFVSDGARQPRTEGLHADIGAAGHVFGRLSVFYAEEKPFLIPYEQDLVEAAAAAVGHDLNRRRVEEAGKKVREELAESLAFTQSLLAALPVPVFTKDLQRRYVTCNPAFTDLLGLTPEQLRGKTVEEVWPSEHAEVYRERDLAVLESGQRQKYEFKIRDRHGEDREVLFVKDLFRNAAGQIQGIIGAYVDITERKRAEQRLLEQQRTLRSILDGIPDVVALQKPDHTIVAYNRAGYDLVGKTPSEVEGRKCYELLGRPEPCATCTSARAVETRRTVSMERFVPELGRWILIHAIPILDDAGQVELIVEQLQDITDRKRAEEELRGTASALECANNALEEYSRLAESANHAKSEFLANMSHELRTPLTAILGYADILAERARDPEHQEPIDVIRRNGDHLLALVNDILDLSKIEAGALRVERTECAPMVVLREVMSLMRMRADAKDLALRLSFDGPCPQTIRTDPIRLRQILVNLVGNAVKFTDRGQVRVVAGLADRETSAPKFVCEVIDTGIGMTQAQVSELFQPFHQVDPSAPRRRGGAGLGLTISRRLARLLGGDISVTSAAGKGSTFRLVIDPGPLTHVKLIDPGPDGCSCTLLSLPPPGDRPRSALPGCRVLLAEDGPDIQRLIVILLEKAGAKVTVVENGQEAIDAIQDRNGRQRAGPSGSFDVILMDMQMPVLDGYEAARRLRESGYEGPIVALTAHAMPEDRKKCLDAGCDDYLAKPIDRQSLLAAVARWSARASAAISPAHGADVPLAARSE